MVRGRQHQLRPDLRRREHHLHPQRHDAGLYQRLLVRERRDSLSDRQHQQDWITTDGGANDGKTGIDSYGYQTYIHEIGHALGLGHQGPYNGSASYSTNAVYANDTWQYSIMSYFSEPNYSGSSYRYVVTPQMADIYAVGLMYGVATSTRTGDTVYGFNSNAGAVFNFAGYTSAPALTIYDSGGNDTLDCSGYSSAQTIDLHPGAFSSVGGLVNNIGIALNAVIEKAIGGSGNDTLIASNTGSTLSGGGGNDTLVGGGGDDRLIGGMGVDNLTGGAGADTFVFVFGDSSASGQHDKITDFTADTDHIDLSAIDAISGAGGIDLFNFIATAGFSGSAGQLNYFYNSSLGVTTLQGDTNGDRIADFAIDLTGNIGISLPDLIGAYGVPVVVESFGSTTFVQAGGNYFLYANGTSSGPSLKYAGTPVAMGQYGPSWAPIAAEQTGAGYYVVWKNASADQYGAWSTDISGNYTANIIGTVSGSSSELKALESTFQQDLNGDGVIGVPAGVTIEAFGSTTFVQAGGNYYLYASGTSSGPSLKYAGTPVSVGVRSQLGTDRGGANGGRIQRCVEERERGSIWSMEHRHQWQLHRKYHWHSVGKQLGIEGAGEHIPSGFERRWSNRCYSECYDRGIRINDFCAGRR